VAVSAVDAVVADVVFMAERNRLVAGHTYVGNERSCVNLISAPDDSAQRQKRRRDADLR